MQLTKVGECLVWNFKTDFFLPARLPSQQAGVTFELCDARTHTVAGATTVPLPPSTQQQRAKTVVVPLHGTTASGNAVVGELTFILSIHDVTLPQNIPLTSSAMLELTVLSAKGLFPSKKPNNYLHTNPYVLITVQSGREKGNKSFVLKPFFLALLGTSHCPHGWWHLPMLSQ